MRRGFTDVKRRDAGGLELGTGHCKSKGNGAGVLQTEHHYNAPSGKQFPFPVFIGGSLHTFHFDAGRWLESMKKRRGATGYGRLSTSLKQWECSLKAFTIITANITLWHSHCWYNNSWTISEWRQDSLDGQFVAEIKWKSWWTHIFWNSFPSKSRLTSLRWALGTTWGVTD